MNPIVAQITRGLAPATAIRDAVIASSYNRADYRLISGRPAAEAKEYAATITLENGVGLLLVEDDVIPSPALWQAAIERARSSGPILVAEAMCRNGTSNIRYNPDGSFSHGGNAFVAIPHDVLVRLPRPVFKSATFGPSPDNPNELVYRGDGHNGRGSDVWFWWQVSQLDPHPGVEVVTGELRTIKHALNTGEYRLDKPSEMEVW